MVKYFQYLEDTAKPGDGFQMYGRGHIIFIICIAIGIFFMIIHYFNSTDKGRLKILRVTSAVILISEIIRQASFVLLLPAYPFSQLPLHMCGLSIFIEIIHALRPNKTTGEILYALGLPGALAALLFPNWTMYPMLSYQAIQSFVVHGLHMAFVLMPLFALDIRPSVRNLWRPVLFLLIVTPAVYILNKQLNTNFFFLNAGSEGSPLEILIGLMGNPGFLIGYCGLLLVVWVILYLPFAILDKPYRRKRYI